MIRAVKIVSIACLACAALLSGERLHAQTAAQVAAEEAVRRQEAIIQIRQRLQEAATVEGTGNLASASILYE